MRQPHRSGSRVYEQFGACGREAHGGQWSRRASVASVSFACPRASAVASAVLLGPRRAATSPTSSLARSVRQEGRWWLWAAVRTVLTAGSSSRGLGRGLAYC